MLKKIALLLILMFSFLVIKFIKYYQIKEDIYYAEHSFLFKYANDYFLISKGNIDVKEFIKFIKKKDVKLYNLFKNKGLNLLKEENGKLFFTWERSQKNDFISNSDFTFWKYFFTRKNVYLWNENLNSEALFYTSDYVYEFKNQGFEKTIPFDKKFLYRAYAYAKNCKKVMAKAGNSDSQRGFLVYLSGEIFFIDSDFSSESETLIINSLKQQYENKKDTFMIDLQFFNTENALCVD